MNINNLLNDINIIKFTVQQILHNCFVILNELDFFEDRYYYGIFNNDFLAITSEENDGIKYFYFKQFKYFRINSILYMEMNNILYWIKNDIFYKTIGDNNIIDTNKTFMSINEQLFKNNIFLIVLNGILKLVNYIIKFDKLISYDEFSIFFIDINKIPYKIINLSKIFVLDKNKFIIKDLNEIFDFNGTFDVISILTFGNFIKYMIIELSSVKFKFFSAVK